jgi:hypothetical protein
MRLTKDEILRSATGPLEELEVPEFGGTVLITSVPMGHERLWAYITAPIIRDDPEANPEPVDIPRNASKAQREATQTANRIITAALSRKFVEPDQDERFRRQAIGTFIMGVVDDQRRPVWGWDDADTIRNTLNYNGIFKVATRIWELSAGASLEEAKSGDQE